MPGRTLTSLLGSAEARSLIALCPAALLPSPEGVPVGLNTLQRMLDSLETIVIGCDHYGRPVLYDRAARELFGTLLDDTPIEQWPHHVDVTNSDGWRLQTDDLSLLRAKSGEHVHDTDVTVTRSAPRSFRIHGGLVVDDGPVAAVLTLR